MPAHGDKAGSIFLQEAYALGKMMDSSGWNGLLRSGITPSDVDAPPVPLCFDNNGAIIFCDFSVSYTMWNKALRGQLRLYEALIKNGPHCAVLCKHNVRPEMERAIDTLRDVDTFHVMVWDFEIVMSPLYDGVYWQSFVTMWVNNRDGPLRLRRHLLGLQAGLVKPKRPEEGTS